MRIKIDEEELLGELKMAYRQFLKAHNITKDVMRKKYGITGEKSDITEVLRIMERRGEVYEENGKFYLTDEGKVNALSRKLPFLDAHSIRDLIKMAKDDKINDKVMMYFEVLNDFFRTMKGRADKYPVDGSKPQRSKFETDMFQTLDNNLFKSMYSAMSSVENFKRSDVTLLGENEKPFETIQMALGQMFNDDTKIFHCSDHVAEMLMLTNNEIYHRMLPFRCIFVDVNFGYKDKIQFWGMLLSAIHKADGGIVLCFDPDDEPTGFQVFAMGIDKSDDMIMYAFTTVFKDGLFKPLKDDRVTRSLAKFACNFLDFLHDPNVQYVKASKSYGRAHKILRRIYESRKIDLDKTYFVRIENPLRRYVDSYIRMRTKIGYSHRFFIRGHFRTLRHPRYGDNVGKKIWIAPFIKGEGVLIEKQYDVEEGRVAPNHRLVKTKEGFP